MVNLKFYPKFIRDIITNVPTICFETIHWNEFLSSSKTIVKNYLKGKPDKDILNFLKQNLPESINLDKSLKGNYIDATTGENLLRIYFAQLKNPHGLFLDLRSIHFHQLSDGTTLWKTNALYHKFSDEFRNTLLELYHSFYYRDDNKFLECLERLGMTKGLSEEKKIELRNLFYGHFGTASQIKFNLSEFQESFLKIFEFFLEAKIKLQTDFIYLGNYLVTLYMHMEKYPESFNVEAIYKEIFPQ